MKKERLKRICVGNFYMYDIYRITDAKGFSILVAEPCKNGATRSALNEEDLIKQLNKDVYIMNTICTFIR